MKKLSIFLLTCALLFSLTSAAGATVFTDEAALYEILMGRGTYEWTHDTPEGFSVPPATVNNATLEVFAKLVSGSDDTISVEGVLQGKLTNMSVSWDWSWKSFGLNLEGTVFDITPVFASWPAGQVLDVALNFNESGCWNSLVLMKSVFTLDYEDGASVPEPAAMLLLGSGLLGLVGIGRKRFKR